MKTNSKFLILATAICSPAIVAADELFTYTPTAYNAGYMFDIQSKLVGEDLRVHKWWYYFSHNSNTAPVLRLYWRMGTYIGHEYSSSGWNLLGEQVVTGIHHGELQHIPFPTLDIAPGATVGIFTTIVNYDHVLTESVAGMGNRQRPFPQILENDELRFTGGTLKVSATTSGGDPFASAGFEGYVWSGLISTAPVPEPSTLAGLGIGFGILALRKRKRSSSYRLR